MKEKKLFSRFYWGTLLEFYDFNVSFEKIKKLQDAHPHQVPQVNIERLPDHMLKEWDTDSEVRFFIALFFFVICLFEAETN